MSHISCQVVHNYFLVYTLMTDLHVIRRNDHLCTYFISKILLNIYNAVCIYILLNSKI